MPLLAQDIAVDGWALSLLSKSNVSLTGSCQTLGLNLGYFTSFTVFVALNDVAFCNKWLRRHPLNYPVFSLGGYMATWGWLFLAFSVWMVLFKKEQPDDDGEGKWVTVVIPIAAVMQ